MTGVVSGAVLKLARQSTGLTQEKFAELLRVDVSTVQGWESGRRPLAAMNAGDFLRLSGRLSRLGAPASTGRHLREAVEADQVLSTGIAAEVAWVDADTHPLAASVHRRTITNLITWPITQKTPEHLREFIPKVARRGPTPICPSLHADERTRFFDHLLTAAERSMHADEALLRRQAVYLLGFDGRPQVVAWLRAEWKRAGCRSAKQTDVTGLLEARSASVALASTGDGTHIHDFVDHMTDTRTEIANLNYWAHWIGELDNEQTSDAFMLDADTRSWTGVRLLQHLMNRLDPDSPHLPLNLHTLHALVASRASLLNGRPVVHASLAGKLDRLASTDCLTRTGRHQLAGLQYALRIAGF
ncbi:transcriptional regulator with XRE-family HTH domain [Kibdelosporangium banguiense]|uniref:Transcriptional regulator with XRE-family HTH domain n=1 Tax=Kibdelosporangium banguiense TaxID=1365924 RepID=A0ABS4TNU8_9PSEU|nr:helix-turn-helix domain-containing protein [Kibdelosporangium banguiense]MBP2325571.1 transcriptional regulator with XRE-family HTH domain [Kibdelosporangium banguiense]